MFVSTLVIAMSDDAKPPPITSRSLSPRNVDWVRYRVLKPLNGPLATLAIGDGFRAYPYGEVVWHVERFGPVVTIGDLERLEGAGLIERVEK